MEVGVDELLLFPPPVPLLPPPNVNRELLVVLAPVVAGVLVVVVAVDVDGVVAVVSFFSEVANENLGVLAAEEGTEDESPDLAVPNENVGVAGDDEAGGVLAAVVLGEPKPPKVGVAGFGVSAFAVGKVVDFPVSLFSSFFTEPNPNEGVADDVALGVVPEPPGLPKLNADFGAEEELVDVVGGVVPKGEGDAPPAAVPVGGVDPKAEVAAGGVVPKVDVPVFGAPKVIPDVVVDVLEGVVVVGAAEFPNVIVNFLGLEDDDGPVPVDDVDAPNENPPVAGVLLDC